MSNWKENKAVGIVAVVVFILAIVVAIFAMQPKKKETTLMSQSTQEVMVMKVAPGVEYPIVNPKTGKKDLYPAAGFKCGSGHTFYIIQNPTVGKEGAPAVFACPKCGSTKVEPLGTEDRKRLE